MDDSTVENRLRRYRPVGPPPRLRERIVATARIRRIWPWASAAAALLVSALTFHVASGYTVATADVTRGPAAAARLIDDLTDVLGSDVAARALAEFIMVEQQIRSETTRAIPTEPSLVSGGELR